MMQKKLKEKFKYPMLNSLSSFYSIANEINLPNYMLRGQPLSPYERNCKIQLAKHINGKIFLVHSSNHFCFSILTIIPLLSFRFIFIRRWKLFVLDLISRDTFVVIWRSVIKNERSDFSRVETVYVHCIASPTKILIL